MSDTSKPIYASDQPEYLADHLDREMFHREMLLRGFGAWSESSKHLSIVDRRDVFWRLEDHHFVYADRPEDLGNLVGPYTYIQNRISVYRKELLVLVEIWEPSETRKSSTQLWVVKTENERPA